MSKSSRGEHVVTFYDRDSELCQSVARFAGEGLQRGEHVLLMATLEHATDIRSMISAAYPHVDHAGAMASGQLLFADADAIARECLRDGAVDRQLFNGVVSKLLARLKPPMRVFGEVVSLVANNGDLEAALEIETLGHQLAHQAGVQVLCAYDLRPLAQSAARAQIEEVHDRAILPAAMREGPVVLLADDYEDARELYRDYLEFSGFTVKTASNGREAVEQAEALLPDLILMDASMPVLDGWQATKELKANPVTKHIPILALTAHAFDDARQEAKASGCDGFVTKPCLPDDLVARVRATLEGGRKRKR